MTTAWPSRPLAECVKFLSGGTPNKNRADFWDGDIPWVSSGEMAVDRILETSLHISEAGLEDGSRLVPPDTTLAVVRGMSLAKDFRVAITTRPVAFNQDLKALVPLNGTHPRFLYYALAAQRLVIRDRASEASHGTKKLPTDVLGSVPIPHPDWSIQERIADILWQYDDLIENNTRRIRLLEDAARLLYEEWFVRLRFPGHEHTPIKAGVPQGWSKRSLTELATIVMGQSPKSTHYNADGEGLPFHQGVTDFGPRFPTHRVFCTVKNRLAEAGDILFSVRAPVGRINIAPDQLVIGRGLSAIRSSQSAQN
jgi:type I restriction enzyme S subunit